MTMWMLNCFIICVVTFIADVSGFSTIGTGSSSRISRVQMPLAMGLFDNILGQGKGKAGRLFSTRIKATS